MNEILVQRLIREFAGSGATSFVKDYKIPGDYTSIYTIKIEKKRRLITDSVGVEARAETISALPAGNRCECCGGSGRAK